MQHDNLWQAVLGEIEVSISRGNYVTWFTKTTLVKHTDELIQIGVPNVFYQSQVEKKYGALITEMLHKNGVPATAKIEFKVAPMQSPAKAETDVLVAQPAVRPKPSRSGSSTALSGAPIKKPTTNSLAHSYRQGLNDRYTFETFIVGSSNDIAFAACQAIAQEPGRKYNPLFLYGGVGIGKTHLIQATGNVVAANNPDARVLYISTEQFVQEFVDALRFRKTADFSNFYRTADVLIVDDIQFIAGKEKIQEEFFHTFNALHQANKQIIISSDRPPGEIPTLEDRLKSRLNGGMSIDMQIPDFETRCAIIQTKAQDHSFILEPKIVEHLANTMTNIRELEGALNQLLAWCEIRNVTPTMDITVSLLGNTKTRPKHISAKQIIERTARHFQIPVDDIIGPKRDKDIVVPRQVAMYMLRNELHLSFPKIAKELGRKDHTTAIHSVAKVQKDSQVDATIRMAIADIKEHLYA